MLAIPLPLTAPAPPQSILSRKFQKRQTFQCNCSTGHAYDENSVNAKVIRREKFLVPSKLTKLADLEMANKVTHINVKYK